MKKLTILLVFLALAAVSFSFRKKPVRRAVKDISTTFTFPVAGKKTSLGDRWHASRDGGRRLHKGIDIYARRGTPVVAIADGLITVKDNTVYGGKTLWLKPAGKAWTAYYAHLDQQLVRAGQYVRKGQVIGTVGNTGNAKHTPSHLHFGITSRQDWVNPLPYIRHSPKVVVKTPASAKASVKKATKKKVTGKNRKARR